MKNKLKICSLTSLLAVAVGLSSCASQPVKRVASVIGIQEKNIAYYKKLHADSNPGVRDLLTKYHMKNFSIYLQKIDGKWYEFRYFEYNGKNYASDMAQMGKEPRTIAWLKDCDPLQTPLPGSKSWTDMERVYFNQ